MCVFVELLHLYFIVLITAVLCVLKLYLRYNYFHKKVRMKMFMMFISNHT